MASEPKFQKGDVVVLKSGGPPMTVDNLPGDTQHYEQGPDDYWCRWFKGATQDSGAFSEHLIEKWTPPKK